MKLITLKLQGAFGRNTTLPPFVEATNFPSLTTLDLRGTGLTAASARRLARSSLLASLERLYLGSNPLGRQGVAAFAQSGNLNRLRMLDLSGCQIDWEGVAALARGRDLECLSALYLRTNRLGDAGLQRLCQAAALANLSVLQVSYYHWSVVWLIDSTQEHAFFCTSVNQAHIIPRRAFRHRQDFETFVDLACRYHKGLPPREAEATEILDALPAEQTGITLPRHL